jgi:hypothetical protein
MFLVTNAVEMTDADPFQYRPSFDNVKVAKAGMSCTAPPK